MGDAAHPMFETVLKKVKKKPGAENDERDGNRLMKGLDHQRFRPQTRNTHRQQPHEKKKGFQFFFRFFGKKGKQKNQAHDEAQTADNPKTGMMHFALLVNGKMAPD
jgi:hypothetical protein